MIVDINTNKEFRLHFGGGASILYFSYCLLLPQMTLLIVIIIYDSLWVVFINVNETVMKSKVRQK